MRRIHAPELEDEAWFPASLRDSLTAFLNVSAEKLHTFAAAAPILTDVMKRNGTRRAVDLCSGGGGPLVSLLENMDGVEAVLTDLYPNLAAFDIAEARLPGRVTGRRESVDATNVPGDLDGVRTIFNALHHFRPEGAAKILRDAAEKKQPLCAFEVVERHPASVAAIAGVPLAVLGLTPWTQPNALRLALTYLLPVIPLATLWDGMASCLRAYSLEELRALTNGINVDGYHFTMGQTARSMPLPLRVTWLVGEPTR